jgi:hypothetical protein
MTTAPNKTDKWLNNIKVLGEFTLLLFGSIIVPLMFIINIYLNYSLAEINSSSLDTPISRLFSILLAGSALGIYFAIFKSENRLKEPLDNKPSKILKFLGIDVQYYTPDSLNKLLVIGMGIVIVQVATIIITFIGYKTSKEATLLTLMLSLVNIVVGVIMDFVVGGHYSTLQEKLKKD